MLIEMLSGAVVVAAAVAHMSLLDPLVHMVVLVLIEMLSGAVVVAAVAHMSLLDPLVHMVVLVLIEMLSGAAVVAAVAHMSLARSPCTYGVAGVD